MKKNMGIEDRVIRILVAVLVVLLYATGVLSGVAAILLLILSGIFIITSYFSICPLYMLFGINTCRKKN